MNFFAPILLTPFVILFSFSSYGMCKKSNQVADSYQPESAIVQKKDQLLALIAEAIAINEFPKSEASARTKTEQLRTLGGPLEVEVRRTVTYLETYRNELLHQAKELEGGLLLTAKGRYGNFVAPMSIQIFYHELMPRVIIYIDKIFVTEKKKKKQILSFMKLANLEMDLTEKFILPSIMIL